jgi:hypothetical protein
MYIFKLFLIVDISRCEYNSTFNYLLTIDCTVGTNLHTDDWIISKTTFEREWSTHFNDVKIPATNRFSKCQTFERLKQLINSGNIVVGHTLHQE